VLIGYLLVFVGLCLAALLGLTRLSLQAWGGIRFRHLLGDLSPSFEREEWTLWRRRVILGLQTVSVAVQAGVACLTALLWIARVGWPLPARAWWDGLLTLAALVFLLNGSGILLPAFAFERDLKSVRRLLIHPMRALTRLVLPLGMLVSSLVSRSPAGLEAAETELSTFIGVGEEAGMIDEEEGELMHSIAEFSDTIVREVMTPRMDMVCIEADRPPEEARELILSEGHSRIPVFETRVDNIVGLLFAKDLFQVWRDGSVNRSVRDLMREPHFVPETKKVKVLLREFQAHKVHMAIVVDEYGGTAGLVTIEDLLEEIVGEIMDEYDDDEPEAVRELSDGAAIVDARTDVDGLAERYGLRLPEDADFETVGGLVLDLVGRVPEKGEQIDYQDAVRFTVLAADARRVLQVKVEPLRRPQREEAEE
jgi:CBS domain containing-hemolysin-like protein